MRSRWGLAWARCLKSWSGRGFGGIGWVSRIGIGALAVGIAQAGLDGPARAITQSSLDLIRKSGFAEYYDPHSGEPLGGGRFTWTAAMVLEFLALAD